MTIVDNKSRYHYFNAFDEEGEIIGGAAVDVTDTMHYRYKSLCKADKTKCAEIIYVKVDKRYRGQGIAKKLLDYAEEYAKENKAIYLQLTCSTFRTSAHKLYEKCGFIKRDSDLYRKELL